MSAVVAPPHRLIGYFTVDQHGQRVQLEVALELKHWKVLYDAIRGAADPSQVTAAIYERAEAHSPQDWTQGLPYALDDWFEPWPARLGALN